MVMNVEHLCTQAVKFSGYIVTVGEDVTILIETLFFSDHNLHSRFSRSDFCHHHPCCIIHSEIFGLIVMDY